MSLIRFRYRPLVRFDRIFDEAFNSGFWPSIVEAGRATRPLAFCPRLDVKENSSDVVATLELPGLKPEDIAVDLQQDRLTVSGEFADSRSEEDETAGYVFRERRFGKFSRTLQIPSGTKPEEVKAKMENGLLTVTFPKATSEQPQRIAVQ